MKIMTRKNLNLLTFQFFVHNEAGNNLSVSRDTFLSILNITNLRVMGVFKRFQKDGALVPVEFRESSRKENLFIEKLQSVMSFIKSLKGTESHYVRDKSVRVYLQSELSVAKRASIYNEGVDENLKVKPSYFRHILNTHLIS